LAAKTRPAVHIDGMSDNALIRDHTAYSRQRARQARAIRSLRKVGSQMVVLRWGDQEVTGPAYLDRGRLLVRSRRIVWVLDHGGTVTWANTHRSDTKVLVRAGSPATTLIDLARELDRSYVEV
jgi:hypothetical protein